MTFDEGTRHDPMLSEGETAAINVKLIVSTVGNHELPPEEEFGAKLWETLRELNNLFPAVIVDMSIVGDWDGENL